MGVKSTTFGGVRLSGQDADKFQNQVTYGRPKKSAKEAAARGRVMLDEYKAKGFVVVTASPKTKTGAKGKVA